MSLPIIIAIVSMILGVGLLGLSSALKAKRAKLIVFFIGLVLIICPLTWTVYIFTKPPESQKIYNIPQLTDWYFVDPIGCKEAKINGIAYDPNKFAEHNNCIITADGNDSGFVMLDCTKMLNNLFFMAKGERKCGVRHLEMKKKFESEAQK